MFKNKLLLLLSIVIILFIIPHAFAQENVTDSAADASTIANNFYFDSNAPHDHGEGTVDNPYKELRDGRILDNSVIHLKNGEYDYSQLNTHTNISFIGEDSLKTVIHGDGKTLVVNKQITLTNITVSNLNIINQGNLFAENVIFINSTANGEDSQGGAIYCSRESYNVYVTNCSFINNYADFGGAIYLNGGILDIYDCIFVNNTASHYGGAIACDSSSDSYSKVTVEKSRFINDFSLSDAGGALYLYSSNFKGEDLIISSCNATFGGAICSLRSYVTLTTIRVYNNTAKYDGGVIYQIYGNLSIEGSNLILNHAQNGGGIYCDNLENIKLNFVSFINNTAYKSAGAIYLLACNDSGITNCFYINNTALENNDILKQDNLSLILLRTNYTLYQTQFDNTNIPKNYTSPLTPVKNQKNGGNCWAFAALGALESAILKASGEVIDLSEENMKNLASTFSHYGWQMDTNEGGYAEMSLGYLSSWLGPVLESQDPYEDTSFLSPVLESILHVQNIVYLKRSSLNDLDSIKQAIMNYGGVFSPIFMAAHYDSQARNFVQYYRGSLPQNHAVVLVGWDDNFYIPGAPGKGAWIAKNSWGENWGDNGYFYVSYYDTSCLKVNENMGGFAFILNDTIKYDKNYQYDIAKTDYFFNTTNTVWYKNIFTSTDNEYLAAVSTYFEKDTRWELSVSVNDILKVKKSGNSKAGYYTLPLDEFIPLNAGDKFEIMFKISVNGDAGVPISEIISLNNYVYHENISYISYDGKNWKDLFNLVWLYPDHIYFSQVACIKAFTILQDIGTNITLSITNISGTDAEITACVLNQWGYPVDTGNVTFTFGGETYTVSLKNGIAKTDIQLKSGNITAEFNSTGYNSSKIVCEIHYPFLKTDITLNITGDYNPVNITAEIVDENGSHVKSGSVLFDICGRKYNVSVLNGYAKLENINMDLLNSTVLAYYSDLFYYNSSHANKTHVISKLETWMYLDISANEANNPVEVTAYIFDLNNQTVNSGYVTFVMSGSIYNVKVNNGVAKTNHTFTELGMNGINVIYEDTYRYNSSACNEVVNVSKMKVNLTFDLKIDGNNAFFYISIDDCVRGFEIYMYVKDKVYHYASTQGIVLSELLNLDKGLYNYTAKLNSPIYESDDIVGEFNIVYQDTQIIASDATVYYNGNYSVILNDNSGNLLAYRDVYLTVNGQTYKKRTDDKGVAVFNLPLPVKNYAARINFIGDDEYLQSYLNVNINMKSTVTFSLSSYTLNSKYTAILYDSNGELLVKKPVKIFLNGVTYNLNTDSKGQIALNINLNPGNYKVEVTNTVTGEVQTHNIKVVKRITENKAVTMYYGAGKLYKVRVCNDSCKFTKGLKVSFKINGKTYYRYTDEKGYASLKINQKPGTYTVTAQYKGFKVSNKITVKSTIITKDIKVKKSKSIKFTAKLVNKNGKILKNKKITFKFKGKTYHIKTNKNGNAVLKINKKYKKGKYTITSKYGNLKIKNSIRII